MSLSKDLWSMGEIVKLKKWQFLSPPLFTAVEDVTPKCEAQIQYPWIFTLFQTDILKMDQNTLSQNFGKRSDPQ